jgi:uncharacterized protein
MKIVFDTNVYISEALTGGLSEAVIDATVGSRWRIFVSEYLIDEFERVMLHELGRPRRFVALARRNILRRAILLELPSSRHIVADDPHDSPILQTALAASADMLVSRDAHLLSLDPYESLRIVSVAAYRQVLQDRGVM